jgi:thiamine-monophosphate kinase
VSEGTVSEVGEGGLILDISARIGSPPPEEAWTGDDAAVVGFEGARLLLTTDIVVQGVDFDPAYSTGADVGWKVVAINASDVAAMGGRPLHALATLALPPDTSRRFVDQLMDGMLDAAERWSIRLVGGDISAAGEVSVGIAMTGVPTGSPVLRSGARPGEAICVTGSLGGAAGGLIALRRGVDAPGLARRHLRPDARVDEGEKVARAGASAMIDLSDGLAVDLGRLMDASETGCEVDTASIPVDEGLAALGDAVDPLELSILGGEDFELLFTISEEALAGLGDATTGRSIPITRIGTVTSGEARLGSDALSRWRERGWDHLLAK